MVTVLSCSELIALTRLYTCVRALSAPFTPTLTVLPFRLRIVPSRLRTLVRDGSAPDSFTPTVLPRSPPIAPPSPLTLPLASSAPVAVTFVSFLLGIFASAPANAAAPSDPLTAAFFAALPQSTVVREVARTLFPSSEYDALRRFAQASIDRP